MPARSSCSPIELEIARREAEGRFAPSDRIAKVQEQLVAAKQALAEVTAKWSAEKVAFERVARVRAMLSNPDAAGDGVAAELESALAQRREIQKDEPMVFSEVDADAVAAVVGDWTGIPVGRMVKDEIASILAISEQLKKRVIGQDHAMDAIAKRIQTSRAKLDNPNKPVGVFMLCGPSGVGKTGNRACLGRVALFGR